MKIKQHNVLGGMFSGTSEQSSFTEAVIKALLDKEKQPPRSQDEIAQDAYAKLQYDFPVLGCDEIEALAYSYRNACMSAKQVLTTQHPITGKLVENVTTNTLAGVRPSQQVQQQADPASRLESTSDNALLDLALSSVPVASTSSLDDVHRLSRGIQGCLVQSGTTPLVHTAAAHQQLAAAILLDHVNSILSASDVEAAHMLEAYHCTHRPDSVPPERHDVISLDQDVSNGRGEVPSTAEIGSDMATPGSAAASLTTPSAMVYEETEAAEQDDDDACYEPLEPVGSGTAANGNVAWQRNMQLHQCSLGSGHTSENGTRTFWAGPVMQGIPSQCNNTSSTYHQVVAEGDAGVASVWRLVASKLKDLCGKQHLASLTSVIPQVMDTDQHVTSGTSRSAPANSSVTAVNSADGVDCSSIGGRKSMVLGKSATKGGTHQTRVVSEGPAAVQHHSQRGQTNKAMSDLTLSNDRRRLWHDDAARAAFLRLIRTLGAHHMSRDLAPILHNYVSVALQWMEEDQQLIDPFLGQLFDELGVSQVASMPKVQHSMKGSKTAAVAVLLPEADLALSMVLQLSNKISGVGKQGLWRQIHAWLLPLLSRCLADINTASQRCASGASCKGSAAQGTTSVATDDAYMEAVLHAMDGVCQVIIWYLENRPGSVRISDTMQSSGILRGLCAMFTALGSHKQCDSLRVALLLTAASSSAALAWAAAVPGVTKMLAAPDFQAGGNVWAHGVAWQLLQASCSKNSNVKPNSVTGSSASLNLTVEQQLQDLCCACDDSKTASLENLQTLQQLLQLMLRAWKVSDKTITWTTSVQGCLKSILANFKATSGQLKSAMSQGTNQDISTQSTAGAVAQTTANTPTVASGTSSSHDSDGVNRCVHNNDSALSSMQNPDSCDDSHRDEKQRDLIGLQQLQMQQVQVECIAVLKELVTEGGKKD